MSLSCVPKSPEGSAGRQAFLSGRKLVLTACPSRAARLGSDLSISGSMQAEAGGLVVGICILGVRLFVRLLLP